MNDCSNQCHLDLQQAHGVKNQSCKIKENTWHRQYGHLAVQTRELAGQEKVDGFDYDMSGEIDSRDQCANGKHHREKFPSKGGK